MTDQEWAEAKFNEITAKFPTKEVIVQALLDAVMHGQRSMLERCSRIFNGGGTVG
jgi:hypothetical protein